MNHNVRRIVSAVALTSLAASMVACQANNFANGPVRFGAASNPAARTSANAAAINEAARRNLPAVPGEFLVAMKPGAGAQAITAQSNARGMNLLSKPVGSSQSGIVLVKAGGGAMGAMSAGSDAQTLQALRSNPAVLYAEPNYIVKLDPLEKQPGQVFPTAAEPQAPNDPMFAKQYHHKNMKTVEGWNVTRGDDFVLAIVDTGVDTKHPDLAAKLLPGYNTVDDTPIVEDGNGHGTHCAGIAAAITNNGVGVAGVAPDVKILPVQVLSKEGSGSYASVAGGIIWAADHGAKVISMSLGGPQSSPVITQAVKHALGKGAMLIAAMGNSGAGADGMKPIKSYPAAEPGVMAIGASDDKDVRARFSQVGEWHSVIAPGVNILSTFPTYATDMPGKDYGAISGTSMATPAVAGLAALVRSKFPQLTAAQAEAHIEATADDLGKPGFDIQYGHGRANVFRALSTPPGFRR